MDLNPDASRALAGSGVLMLEQDCTEPWPLDDGQLDVVFTSNFFEHLLSKQALSRTLEEVFRCLRPGGRLIAMGPNASVLPGKYWDFWDNLLPLTDLSLAEGLELQGFEVHRRERKFLPYTMVGAPEDPFTLLRAYLRLRPAWWFLGGQFLVIADRPMGQSLPPD
jgi:SAM-dependent methyltransferase